MGRMGGRLPRIGGVLEQQVSCEVEYCVIEEGALWRNGVLVTMSLRDSCMTT